jgi:hypothetical protein
MPALIRLYTPDLENGYPYNLGGEERMEDIILTGIRYNNLMEEE